MNAYVGQLQGKFSTEDRLVDIIFQNCRDGMSAQEYESSILKIYKIGIYSKPYHQIELNGKIEKLGKTGILEIRDSEIKDLHFLQEENEDTFIDYIISIN